jgi:Family of unknown function (DUF6516)
VARAELLVSTRTDFGNGVFTELRVWRVPKPVPGSAHSYKYRLALVIANRCVLRYDNETGKGDHRHTEGVESALWFESVDQILDDFERDVEEWLQR